MDARATLLVGATKGAFLLDPGPGGWSVRGPLCDGWPINHMAGGPATGALWAAGGGGRNVGGDRPPPPRDPLRRGAGMGDDQRVRRWRIGSLAHSSHSGPMPIGS